MTTEVCVSNGLCFPPRRVVWGHPIPVGDCFYCLNVLKYAWSVNSTLRLLGVNIKESQQPHKDVWKIVNEYDDKDKTKVAEKWNDKWNDLKMIPNGQLKDFFSRVDSLISEFHIKYQIIITNAEILVELKRKYPSTFRSKLNRVKGRLVKPIMGRGKNDGVWSCADKGQARINTIKDGGRRSHEAYVTMIDPLRCFSSNKARLFFGIVQRRKSREIRNITRIRDHCEPEKRVEPKKLAEENVSRVRCQQKGHLATACPYRSMGFKKKW